MKARSALFLPKAKRTGKRYSLDWGINILDEFKRLLLLICDAGYWMLDPGS
jgi:hypothetical protein